MTRSNELAVLVLAAGKGTRMKSATVKVMHPLMGQPILAHILNSARYLQPAKTVLVVGHQAELIEASFSGAGLIFVRQEKQLGTGDAAASARGVLADFQGTVLILSGDVPLLSPQTMMDFLAAHHQSRVPLSVLTVELSRPGSYGRVIRDDQGFLLRLVEARDATPEERAIKEINTGIYAVDAALLFEAVQELKPENDQREYYLTDVAAQIRDRGHLAAAIICPDPEEVQGINDRLDLAAAVNYLKARINKAWMLAGVTMIDPQTNYIETTVKLSPDVTLWPGAALLGRTTIESGASIGPNCQVCDAVIGQDAVINAGSVVNGITVPSGARIGPLAVLGPE